MGDKIVCPLCEGKLFAISCGPDHWLECEKGPWHWMTEYHKSHEAALKEYDLEMDARGKAAITEGD